MHPGFWRRPTRSNEDISCIGCNTLQKLALTSAAGQGSGLVMSGQPWLLPWSMVSSLDTLFSWLVKLFSRLNLSSDHDEPTTLEDGVGCGLGYNAR